MIRETEEHPVGQDLGRPRQLVLESLATIQLAIRRSPSWTVVLAATCAAAFMTLALLAALGATRSIDLTVMRAFQSVASDPLDLLANAHTILGQLAITLPLAAVLAVVAWRRLGGYAWLAPLLILWTGAVELVFKLAVRHGGPPAEFIRASHNVLGVKGPPDAFPSGHVARITFLALILVALWPSRASVVAAALAIASTVYLRVYIGDHWISDALGGMALGAGFGALGAAWMTATRRR